MIAFYSPQIHELTVKFIPHCMLPEHVRDVIVEEMSKQGMGLFDSCPRGVFLQYEVGAHKREGMLEAAKILEDWLESEGIHQETVLLQWDW